jgi:hypothetical protein
MSGALVPTYSTISRCHNPDDPSRRPQILLSIRFVSLVYEVSYSIESV